MSNSFLMSFKSFLFFIIVVTLIICFFFIPMLCTGSFTFHEVDGSYSFSLSNFDYLWPTPGYTSINSYFGKRDAPTFGASTYHAGIDIGAPENSKLLAITSGEITFASFLGGGGYTITLTKGNMKITYCHVSPHYIVKVGDFVLKGQIIRLRWSQKCLRGSW